MDKDLLEERILNVLEDMRKKFQKRGVSDDITDSAIGVIWEKVHNNPELLRNVADLQPYFFVAVKNEINSLKAEHRQYEALKKHIASEIPFEGNWDPHQSLAWHEMGEVADLLLQKARVKEVVRKATIAAAFHGFSYKEIGSTLGKSDRTVESYVAQGKEVLGKLLGTEL